MGNLNKQQIEKIKMSSLLGVSQGSVNDPRVVVFEWNLKKNIKPTILVGKGVTFDTGGISLKSPIFPVICENEIESPGDSP